MEKEREIKKFEKNENPVIKDIIET